MNTTTQTLFRQGAALGRIAVLTLFMALSACGGGGGGSAVAPPAPKAWGTAALIETDDVGNASDPQIAFDASGNALAVWSQFDGANNNIVANRYTVGSGWGTAVIIETDNAGGAWTPHIAFDASGNALAVWTQTDGTRYNSWANRYTAGSGWGTAEIIETDNAGSAGSPQIAFDMNGDALAVWQQTDSSTEGAGTRSNIWANRFQ